MAKNIKEFARLFGSKKRKRRELRVQVGTRGDVVMPKVLRDAFRLAPGFQVAFSPEGDRLVLRLVRQDTAETLERIDRSGRPIRRFQPHKAYESELRLRRP